MVLNFVLGTAAELIKVYPMIVMAKERGYKVRVLSTGQGRENFLMQYQDFGLPAQELVPLVESQGDLDRASKALKWFLRALLTPKKVLKSRFLFDESQPSYAVVHGDTLSTLVGSWMAKRAGLGVVHIEAGLRSGSLFHPFPEEITRRFVSRIARWHMAPDERAVQNLKKAEVKGHVICTDGNTLKDAVRLVAAKAPAAASPYVLVNVHRFENLNSPSRWNKIVETVLMAAKTHRVVFVMHPQTEHRLQKDESAQTAFNAAKIELSPRLRFSEFIKLLKGADYMISDGGSNQEECSYMGKPCLLMREWTERFEGLETCCVLSQFNSDKITRFIENFSALKFEEELTASGSPTAKILNALDTRG